VLLFNPISLVVLASIVFDLLDDGGTGAAGGTSARSRSLKLLEQTLVEVDGQDLYVAIVRNESRTRTAMRVRPEGEFLDRSGRAVGWPDSAGWVDNMPSLAPGQTGVVIDYVDDGYESVADAVARLRPVASRMSRFPTRPPVRVSRVRLDRGRCIATGRVRSPDRRLQADLAVVVRNRRGQIVRAGWWVAGPLERGSSPQVLARVSPWLCVRHGTRAEVYPNPSLAELRADRPRRRAARSSERGRRSPPRRR
jgi:hypothetical protein